MPKIRVDAESVTLLGKVVSGGYVPAGTAFEMPRIYGMEIDATQRIPDRLAQPVKLRRNTPDQQPDKDGSYYHLHLTRHGAFTVMVPVILSELNSKTDSPAGEITSHIGCV